MQGLNSTDNLKELGNRLFPGSSSRQPGCHRDYIHVIHYGENPAELCLVSSTETEVTTRLYIKWQHL